MLRLVTFDPFRTLGIPGARYVKPEAMESARDAIAAADFVLFPATWQVNALEYGWRKRIYPSPASYRIGFDKVEMTRAFAAVVPEAVPRTLILPSGPDAVDRAADELGFPLVVKEPRNSMGRGVFLAESRPELAALAARLPVLYVQERLPIDRDLRVVVVGGRVVAAYWRIGREGGFHTNVSKGGTVSFDDVPPAALELVDRTAAALGVDHAGFDVAMTPDGAYLLELNVLFGNAGLTERGIHVPALIHAHLLTVTSPPPVLPLAG